MDIYFLGGSAFKIKGKNATTIMDAGKVAVESAEQIREFTGPGEYETKGVVITGLSAKSGVIFSVNQDRLNLVYLGLQGESLSEEQMQHIVETDILFISSKSGPAISQLEPKIIITMDEKETVEPVGKLSITKEKLPEEPVVVVLKHG